MKNKFLLGLALSVTLTLGACSYTNALLGDSASAQSRSYAEYIFDGFKDIWVPALATYRAQPLCGPSVTKLCYQEDVYKKLYVATDAATGCMVTSTEPSVTVQELESCLSKVNDAKMAFTQNSLTPAGAK